MTRKRWFWHLVPTPDTACAKMHPMLSCGKLMEPVDAKTSRMLLLMLEQVSAHASIPPMLQWTPTAFANAKITRMQSSTSLMVFAIARIMIMLWWTLQQAFVVAKIPITPRWAPMVFASAPIPTLISIHRGNVNAKTSGQLLILEPVSAFVTIPTQIFWRLVKSDTAVVRIILMLLSIMLPENVNAKTSTMPRWIQALECAVVKTLITPKWVPTASVTVPIPMLIWIL